MKHLLRMVITALFSAIGIVLVSFVRFPLFASAQFLKYDLADIPVILSSLFFGPILGLASLLIICFFQAFMLGDDGVIGFLMHFISSGLMVVVMCGVYYLFNKAKTHIFIGLAAGLFAAIIAMTGAMLILNYIITPIHTGLPREVVVKMLPTIILPFNLLKGLINSILTVIVFKPISHFAAKTNYLREILWLPAENFNAEKLV